MPYIPKNEREVLDHHIDELACAINKCLGDEDLRSADGRCNYAICELLMKVFDIPGIPRYTKMNTLMGVLECVKLEIYRRIIGYYEDVAIAKSTDIATFFEARKMISELLAELQK